MPSEGFAILKVTGDGWSEETTMTRNTFVSEFKLHGFKTITIRGRQDEAAAIRFAEISMQAEAFLVGGGQLERSTTVYEKVLPKVFRYAKEGYYVGIAGTIPHLSLVLYTSNLRHLIDPDFVQIDEA